jgi:hypothetical protein
MPQYFYIGNGENSNSFFLFDVLTAETVKNMMFWGVTP